MCTKKRRTTKPQNWNPKPRLADARLRNIQIASQIFNKNEWQAHPLSNLTALREQNRPQPATQGPNLHYPL